MASDHRRTMLGAGLVALAVTAFVVVRLTREPEARMPERRVVAEPIAPPAAAVPSPSAPAQATPHVRRRHAAKEREMTFTPLKPGEHAGLAVFPPPGTKPIKHGIVVPEGFELPPGYVRHYQATDDGRRLPPILMFHPDYELVDAQGNPVPMPENRVVPPEMAPPGLPVQMLDDPAQAATSQGRAR